MSTKKKILIISDSPCAPSGFGRITRDLAFRIHEHMADQIEVATLGYGAISYKLPWKQYYIHSIEQWLIPELPEVWKDFAGYEEGIIMTIWDASRLLWFSRPDTCPIPPLKHFLETAPIEKWGYFPIDSEGPQGKLNYLLSAAMEGYDRRLAYTDWGALVMDACITGTKHEHIPHGIDTSVFKPRDKSEAKKLFGHKLFGTPYAIGDEVLMIGIIAGNQPRKDFGLGFEAASLLLKQGINVRLWLHTDLPYKQNGWDMQSLVVDFGLQNRVIMTNGDFTDEQMSWGYQACDVTLGVGLGEGFGFPIFESLACGVPCIHGNYGGAAEFMPPKLLVRPSEYHFEAGGYNCKRPVYDASRWVARIREAIRPEHSYSLPQELDWNTLWPRWQAWLAAGLKEKPKVHVPVKRGGGKKEAL